MNEKSIDQIEEEVLICEISDEAVEAAGTRTEIAGVWTFVCTGGIECHHGLKPSSALQAFYDSLDAKQKKAFDTGGRIGGISDWWRKK